MRRWQVIVPVVSDSLKKQPISWREGDHELVVSVRILDETFSELSMEDLDHTADHLTDLIEQEGLSLEIKADELDRSGV